MIDKKPVNGEKKWPTSWTRDWKKIAVVIAILLAIIITILAIVLTGGDAPAVAPAPPSSLTRDDNLTNQTQIAFSWDPPENNGGAKVIDYSVEI